MNKVYWKVWKDDIKFLKNASSREIECWSSICDRYQGYIYICCCSERPHYYNFMEYLPSSILYLQKNGYKYMGEFNLARIRRDKLKKLSKNE